MHDPRLLQFSSQAVAEMGGRTELVLSQASTSASYQLLKPTASNSSHDTTPPPTYADVQADEGYEEEIVRDPEEKTSNEPCCDQNCRCVCHTTEKAVPDGLVARRAPFPCIIARFAQACTKRGCKKRKRRSKGTFTISPEVLNEALGVRLLSKGFNRLFFLKSYNKISESSDQIRYVTSGNLQGLAMLVQTNQATINDCGDDGWSLLHVRNVLLSSDAYTYVESPLHIGAISTLSCGCLKKVLIPLLEKWGHGLLPLKSAKWNCSNH
jgi:hypothetical protein